MNKILDFREVPQYVHDYFKKYSYDDKYYNEYIEISFWKNDHGIFIKCWNIEIVHTLLFIVPIPDNEVDFRLLMKLILKVN